MEKNGYVYADTIKGMHGLPQAGIIENDFITKISHHMDTTSV